MKRCLLIFVSVLLSHLVLSAADTIAFQSGDITFTETCTSRKERGHFPLSFITTEAPLEC